MSRPDTRPYSRISSSLTFASSQYYRELSKYVSNVAISRNFYLLINSPERVFDEGLIVVRTRTQFGLCFLLKDVEIASSRDNR